MKEHSLFGEIVLRLSAHPENLATEALAYILSRGSCAWGALRRHLSLADVDLPDRVSIRTQAPSGDASVPDLIGTDHDGVDVLVLEAKFWAGLTRNQPTAYLDRLPDDRPSMLAFVAPGLRMESLWGKLHRACARGNVHLGDVRQVATEFRCAAVGERSVLALLSWRSLLGALHQGAISDQESDLAADIDQLSGLCARMDSDAFLPLGANDLSPEIGRRVRQFADLVDSAVHELVNSHGASTGNWRTGGSKSAYGRYFQLGGLGFFLAYHPELWARHSESPLWLSVKQISSGDWKAATWITDVLQRTLAAERTTVVVDSDGTSVPVHLPTGVERDDVVQQVVTQIKRVASICTPTSRPPETGPDDA